MYKYPKLQKSDLLAFAIGHKINNLFNAPLIGLVFDSLNSTILKNTILIYFFY